MNESYRFAGTAGRTGAHRRFLHARIFVSAVASVYLMASGPALCAAEADSAGNAPAADDSSIAEVTVTGIRASLEKAMDTKRNADAFVDAISAEDIGKFPDKNVAESLSRVPGVTISHDWGDGEQVSIEGTDPSLNRSLLNGQTVATGEWYWANAEYPSRSFNFTLLPSPVVGDLEVYKSAEARIDEGSLGGTVIIHTRNPLDMAPFTNSIAVDGNYNDRAGKAGEDLSALLSWHNDADTFGVAVSGIRQDEFTRRDGIEVFGYSQDVVTLANGTTLNNGNPVNLPNGINSTMLSQERLSTGGTFSAQYKPTDRWDAGFNFFYNFGQYNNTDQSFYIQPGTVYGGAPILAGTVQHGTLVSAQFGSVPGCSPAVVNSSCNGLENDAFSRTATVQTYQADMNLGYRGDGWKATIDGGYTAARISSDEYSTEFVTNTPFSYNLTGNTPQYSIPFNPGSLTTLNYFLGTFDGNHGGDSEGYVQADYIHDLDLGPFNAIMAGVKYRDHTNYVTEFNYDNVSTDPNNPANFVPYTTSSVANSLLPANHLEGISSGGIPIQFPMVNAALQKAFVTNGVMVGEPGAEAGNFSIHEKSYAGYVEAPFASGAIHGNFGIRYVVTDQTADFNDIVTGAGVTPTFLNPTGGVVTATPVTVHHPYDDIEPSLNMVYDLSKDDLLRLAIGRVMARDNYGDLAGALSLNPTNLQGSRGNPDLLPYRSTNFALSDEWYGANHSLVAVAAFYKKIQSYVTSVIVPEQYNVAGFGEGLYQITVPENGGGAHAEGLELQAQHDIWGGFGALASYTYTLAAFDNGGPLPSSSRHAISLTGYYEDEDFSTRLSYTYRTPWFVLIDSNGENQYHGAEGELDYTATYTISKNVSMNFDAINLLDLASTYYDDSPANPYATYKSGRRFRLGTKVNF